MSTGDATFPARAVEASAAPFDMTAHGFVCRCASRTRLLFIVAATASTLATARGVILLGTGDPDANTTAPTGALASSGWQYQGTFGAFLGTAIAPQFFMTAQHVAGASPAFIYNGTSYNLVQLYNDPFSDLSIWQVSGVLPSFAPIYAGSNETGQPLVVFGRGTQRGGEVLKNGQLRGWFWGGGDGRQRWGENAVSAIVNGGPLNEFVYSTFDLSGTGNEAHLSSGDSGGAVFINEGGIWKLAGINYAVDGPFFTDASGGGGFFGALFDARDFYYQASDNPPTYTLITGKAPVPSGFYASRISSKRGWIYSVIDPNGDIDGDGISNLLDYARSLNAPAPAGPGSPTVAKEGGALAMTFRRLARGDSLVYTVERSENLKTWEIVTQAPVFVSSLGDVHTLKVQVPMTGDRLFLRVRVAQQ